MNDLAGVLVVVPTASARRTDSLLALRATLADRGARVVIVANGRSAADALSRAGVKALCTGENLGFARAVNLGAATHDEWQWLVIANDDIEITDPSRLDVLARDAGTPAGSMLSFGDEAPRPLPAIGGVLTGLGLLSAVARRFGRRPAPDRALFFPFSFVAIDRRAWSLVGRLDERFPFTYEDADYSRRATAAGVRQTVLPVGGVAHLRSATSGRHIDAVLPVSTWGAVRYLEKWYPTQNGLRLACTAALIVRFVGVPFARVPVGAHLRGIVGSLRVTAFGRQPRLPAFETL